MWRDVDAVEIPSGKYDLLSNLRKRLYDTKAYISYYTSLVSLLVSLTVIGFSYVPFIYDFKEKEFQNKMEWSESYWEENGSKWDEYGCDA